MSNISTREHRESRFDSEILDLIPHREPMLLINHLLNVSANASEALVVVDQKTPFYQTENSGVPAWIGLEYMGQTSALIAGHQRREGLIEAHLGFLMGVRKYQTNVPYFNQGENLVVLCEEAALVGDSLATFNCTIRTQKNSQELATAMLSVFRRPL